MWQYFTPGEGNRPLITDEPKTLLKKICNNLYSIEQDEASETTGHNGYTATSVSSAGNTSLTSAATARTSIYPVTALAGAGPYVANIDLEGTNRSVGDIAEIPIIYSASTNQTIVVRDGVSDTSLIGAGQVGNGTVYSSLVRAYFDGTNWKLLSWN